ncbi:MAG: DNA polymerase IV, partial [Fimbriimonadaceae bacterium]|nr:DNA polymerase IV [Alphaproteobacteria bacterium]
FRDVPLIVGGGKRGVVAAACYIARTYGVHSAMPMFKALKACPHAVVVAPDIQKYSSAGREIRALMGALTPLVEPLSIDEAFLDLTGTQRLHKKSPAQSLANLANRIEKEIGVTVSVGLSHNKFLAKIASDLDKPRGFAVIGKLETDDILRDKPVGIIWGVGKAFRAKLAKDGIRKISDIRTLDLKEISARYGAMGTRLYHLSRGIDTRLVTPGRATKSVSSETTFSEDISDRDELERRLWQQAERTARRLKASEIAGRIVTLKLTSSKFKTITRRRTLGEPTCLSHRIFANAKSLLAVEPQGTSYRLIGVGVSDLCRSSDADGADFLDPRGEKQNMAESAIDAVRAKFGDQAMAKGRGFSATPTAPRSKPEPD